MTILLLLVLFTLSVSFLCSLLEATLLSLTPSQTAALTERHPGSGRIWQGFKRNIERPIAVILIVNTAGHTIGASMAGARFDALYGSGYLWLFSIVFTFLMVQYTEILPKTLGVYFNRDIARFAAAPMEWGIWLLSPVIRSVYWLNRPFESRRAPGKGSTLDEITALAAMARTARQIGRHEERIINAASHLAEVPLRSVMIPIEQVVMIEVNQNAYDAFIAAHEDNHTRFPVRDGDAPDTIIGYINFKELVGLLHTNPNMPGLRGIVRPVHFVDPDESAATLMRTFIEQHIHMAIVRDATGKCLGLITMEDLVEELVGDLEDEFDRLPRHIHDLGNDTWMVGGGVSVAAFAQATGCKPPVPEGTLAAWLAGEKGSPIARGTKVHHDGVDVIVRRVRRGRAFEVTALRPRIIPLREAGRQV